MIKIFMKMVNNKSKIVITSGVKKKILRKHTKTEPAVAIKREQEWKTDVPAKFKMAKYKTC